MEIKEAIEKCDFMNNALNFQRADSDECSCALQMAISALEKQEKISRTVLEGKYFCPRCKCLMFHSGYCKNCGQNTY